MFEFMPSKPEGLYGFPKVSQHTLVVADMNSTGVMLLIWYHQIKQETSLRRHCDSGQLPLWFELARKLTSKVDKL